MKRAVLLLFCLPVAALAQFSNATSIWGRPIASTAPTDGQTYIWSAAQGMFIPASGSGGGGVSSVQIAGTANQLTASGTCTITTTGVCTLSIPSAFLLPGTINKLTLTAPATAATLTIIDGTTVTGPPVSGTMATTGNTETLSLKTLITPTIASFVNANHDHSNGAGGGQISSTAFAAGSKNGNGTKFQMFTGSAPAANDCAKFDVDGNIVGAGAACGAGGGGTVSVVGGGALNSTSVATGGGTTTIQTPSAGTTLDSSGNFSTPGSVTTGNGGSANGQVALSGVTSGTVTTKVQDAAGTYNFNLPTAAGTAGQPLLSGGGGTNPHTYGTLAVPAGGTGGTTFTADLPLLGNGASAIAQGTRQGNTTKYVSYAGSAPSTNDCAKFDANGNVTTAGTGCGGGGGATFKTYVNTTAGSLTAAAGYVATTVAIPAGTITASTTYTQFEATWFGTASNNSGSSKNVAYQADFCTVSGCGSGTVVHGGAASGNMSMGTTLTDKGWSVTLACQIVSVVTTSLTLWCQGNGRLQTSSTGSATLPSPNTATIVIDPTVDQYLSLHFTTMAADTLASSNLFVRMF